MVIQFDTSKETNFLIGKLDFIGPFYALQYEKDKTADPVIDPCNSVVCTRL